MAVAPTLYDFLPRHERATNDLLLDRFLQYIATRNLELYPAQETAILELYANHNVILNTPTGSGKSLVATALHFKALAQGRRSVYTCPIKALVNEKWLALCREFGPQNVGLATGDATINREAPILCCTAEILANIALRDGPDATLHDVISDEFHYYSDRDRGVAWQIPLLTLPQARFLLMSATLGDTEFFERELSRLTSANTVTVKSATRPVPLEFSYAETPLAQTLEQLAHDQRTPVYVVHFTQLEAAESAQDFMSLNVATRDEKAALGAALESFRFNSPHGPDIQRWLRHGIGIHHAGLLPKYRILVEQLAQKGLLKIICGTDTLGVGINVPIRTVLFTRLCKFDGQKTAILTVRDFHQIAGRAGRKGYDNLGWVVAQAPEHVVENLKLEEKARRDGRKIVKRRPPEHNFVPWDRNTFTRLINAAPERLVSRFQVSHAMLLNVLGRQGDGCAAMRQLIRSCHDSPQARRSHSRRAWQLFRSLLDRQIVEFSPHDAPGPKLRVHLRLQDDFSLDQTLSLYLLDTLPLLDPAAPDHALNIITLAEAILEDPDIILRRQLDRIKGEKIAEWKAEGMEYQDRMEELEKLEHPKPLRDFIYDSFNTFARTHPWVGQENIRPKSIAREMFETFASFEDYIKRYELHRAEGVLLRHLTSVLKVLRQTVPEDSKPETIRDFETYLAALIRHVDSSLLDEWERLKNPDAPAAASPASPTPLPPGAPKRDLTRDPRELAQRLRNRVFLFLKAWARGDDAAALAALPSAPANPDDEPWTIARLASARSAYLETHPSLLLTPEARNSKHAHIRTSVAPPFWTLDQVLVDPDGHNDWSATFSVDLAATRAADDPVFSLIRIAPIGR